MKESVEQKDNQIASLENEIRVENERVRSRSLSSAESDGSGPSGIAALRSHIDHMGFDGASMFSESVALSSEDQSNLDRLMLLPSSSTLQASSNSLLNDSQMGFVFLKHKVYNYDNGENESSSPGATQHQLLTGLFAKDAEFSNPENPPSFEGNNLFKEDKPQRRAPDTKAAANKVPLSLNHTDLFNLDHHLPGIFRSFDASEKWSNLRRH